MLLIGLIIIGVVGIKVTTDDRDEERPVQNRIKEEGVALAWIYLVIASLGEIFGVMSINLYLT